MFALTHEAGIAFGNGPGSTPTIFMLPSDQCRTLMKVAPHGVPSVACNCGYCPAGMSPFLNTSGNIGAEGVFAATVEPEVEQSWIVSITPVCPGATIGISISVEGPTAPVNNSGAS